MHINGVNTFLCGNLLYSLLNDVMVDYMPSVWEVYLRNQ